MNFSSRADTGKTRSHSLGFFDAAGLTAFPPWNSLRKHRPEVPFIFLSGTIGEELAVEALREGATDYVLKDRMARLPIAIRRALAEVENTKRRRQDE